MTKKRNEYSIDDAAIGLGIGAPVGEFAASKIPNKLVKDLQEIHDVSFVYGRPSDRLAQLTAYFSEKHNVDPKFEFRAPLEAYSHVNNTVYGNLNVFNKYPEIFAHELGHAKDFSKFPKLKKFTHFLTRPDNAKYAPLALVPFADARPYIPLALGGLLAGNLYKEIKASKHGYNALKEIGASAEELLKARKNLIRAGGTYALGGLGAVAGTYGLMKLLSKVKDKKRNGSS